MFFLSLHPLTHQRVVPPPKSLQKVSPGPSICWDSYSHFLLYCFKYIFCQISMTAHVHSLSVNCPLFLVAGAYWTPLHTHTHKPPPSPPQQTLKACELERKTLQAQNGASILLAMRWANKIRVTIKKKTVWGADRWQLFHGMNGFSNQTVSRFRFVEWVTFFIRCDSQNIWKKGKDGQWLEEERCSAVKKNTKLD